MAIIKFATIDIDTNPITFIAMLVGVIIGESISLHFALRIPRSIRPAKWARGVAIVILYAATGLCLLYAAAILVSWCFDRQGDEANLIGNGINKAACIILIGFASSEVIAIGIASGLRKPELIAKWTSAIALFFLLLAIVTYCFVGLRQC